MPTVRGASRILLIGADRAGLQPLAAALEQAGYDLLRAFDADEGLREARAFPPEAVLFSGEDEDAARQLLGALRTFFDRPVILVSSEEGLAASLKALEFGADDVIVEPLRMEEVIARLRAALRRPTPKGSAVLTVGDVEIDMGRRLVRRAGKHVPLSIREYGLLLELAKAGGHVVSHAQLLSAVWGPERTERVEYLRVFVQSLRRKLEDNPADPKLICTSVGVGYRLGS